MVKNQVGGKHKHQAKKVLSDTSSRTTKFVISTDPSELYAIVTKKFGNNMFQVHCIDNKIRLCIVRGKFRGKHKKSNFVNLGSWLLVGLRDWETQKENEKMKCDLLEIYSLGDVDRLQKTVSENWKILIDNDISKSGSSGLESGDVIFTDEVEEQILPSKPISLDISGDSSGEEFDWIDDI